MDALKKANAAAQFPLRPGYVRCANVGLHPVSFAVIQDIAAAELGGADVRPDRVHYYANIVATQARADFLALDYEPDRIGLFAVTDDPPLHQPRIDVHPNAPHLVLDTGMEHAAPINLPPLHKDYLTGGVFFDQYMAEQFNSPHTFGVLDLHGPEARFIIVALDPSATKLGVSTADIPDSEFIFPLEETMAAAAPAEVQPASLQLSQAIKDRITAEFLKKGPFSFDPGVLKQAVVTCPVAGHAEAVQRLQEAGVADIVLVSDNLQEPEPYAGVDIEIEPGSGGTLIRIQMPTFGGELILSAPKHDERGWYFPVWLADNKRTTWELPKANPQHRIGSIRFDEGDKLCVIDCGDGHMAVSTVHVNPGDLLPAAPDSARAAKPGTATRPHAEALQQSQADPDRLLTEQKLSGVTTPPEQLRDPSQENSLALALQERIADTFHGRRDSYSLPSGALDQKAYVVPLTSHIGSIQAAFTAAGVTDIILVTDDDVDLERFGSAQVDFSSNGSPCLKVQLPLYGGEFHIPHPKQSPDGATSFFPVLGTKWQNGSTWTMVGENPGYKFGYDFSLGPPNHHRKLVVIDCGLHDGQRVLAITCVRVEDSELLPYADVPPESAVAHARLREESRQALDEILAMQRPSGTKPDTAWTHAQTLGEPVERQLPKPVEAKPVEMSALTAEQQKTAQLLASSTTDYATAFTTIRQQVDTFPATVGHEPKERDISIRETRTAKGPCEVNVRTTYKLTSTGFGTVEIELDHADLAQLINLLGEGKLSAATASQCFSRGCRPNDKLKITLDNFGTFWIHAEGEDAQLANTRLATLQKFSSQITAEIVMALLSKCKAPEVESTPVQTVYRAESDEYTDRRWTPAVEARIRAEITAHQERIEQFREQLEGHNLGTKGRIDRSFIKTALGQEKYLLKVATGKLQNRNPTWRPPRSEKSDSRGRRGRPHPGH